MKSKPTEIVTTELNYTGFVVFYSDDTFNYAWRIHAMDRETGILRIYNRETSKAVDTLIEKDQANGCWCSPGFKAETREKTATFVFEQVRKKNNPERH